MEKITHYAIQKNRSICSYYDVCNSDELLTEDPQAVTCEDCKLKINNAIDTFDWIMGSNN